MEIVGSRGVCTQKIGVASEPWSHFTHEGIAPAFFISVAPCFALLFCSSKRNSSGSQPTSKREQIVAIDTFCKKKKNWKLWNGNQGKTSLSQQFFAFLKKKKSMQLHKFLHDFQVLTAVPWLNRDKLNPQKRVFENTFCSTSVCLIVMPSFVEICGPFAQLNYVEHQIV